jgi:hypothetical protein
MVDSSRGITNLHVPSDVAGVLVGRKKRRSYLRGRRRTRPSEPRSKISETCASCHGVHDILPSSDPRSTINLTNLPQTCGKCHPGIGTRLGREFFRIHAPPGAAEGKPWLVNLVTRIYIVLIVVTIGGMAGFNFLDYLANLFFIDADPQGKGSVSSRLPWHIRVQPNKIRVV